MNDYETQSRTILAKLKQALEHDAVSIHRALEAAYRLGRCDGVFDCVQRLQDAGKGGKRV